jgi:hypothetical protein
MIRSQWIFAAADHPYQLKAPNVSINFMHGNRFIYNKPIGIKKEPMIREGILISGFPFPPFLSASYSWLAYKPPVNCDTDFGIYFVGDFRTK